VNLLPTVGRAGPKPQLTPDGRSMRGNCSGTNHRRAELKRTLADFNGNGQSGLRLWIWDSRRGTSAGGLVVLLLSGLDGHLRQESQVWVAPPADSPGSFWRV